MISVVNLLTYVSTVVFVSIYIYGMHLYNNLLDDMFCYKKEGKLVHANSTLIFKFGMNIIMASLGFQAIALNYGFNYF